MTEKLFEVSAHLNDQGVICYYDHPGYIAVPTGDSGLYYIFGFANGNLGWDHGYTGQSIECGESELSEAASVVELADYIVATVKRP